MTDAAEIDRLSRRLAAGADHQIRRALAVIDGLHDRGAVDALVAPVRNRLARMAPDRPLNLTRLLFLPLDPAIVPQSAWQHSRPGFPRPVIGVLGQALRLGLSETDLTRLTQIDAKLRGVASRDTEQILTIGGPVWTQAAAHLVALPCPRDWRAATSLDQDAFSSAVATAALALAVGVPLMRLRHGPADRAAFEREAASLCASAIAWLGAAPQAERIGSTAGASALATMLAAMLLRAPRPDWLFDVAERLAAKNPKLGRALRLSLQFMIERLVASASEGTLAFAADAVTAAERTLAALERAKSADPLLRQLVQDGRRGLDAACRIRFTGAPKELVGPDGQLLSSPAERLALASDIRRFALASGRARGADFYTRALADLAGRIGAPTAGAELAERGRLVGTLTGSSAPPPPG